MHTTLVCKTSKKFEDFCQVCKQHLLEKFKERQVSKRFQQLLKWRNRKMQFDEPTKKMQRNYRVLHFRHCQSVFRLFKDSRFDRKLVSCCFKPFWAVNHEYVCFYESPNKVMLGSVLCLAKIRMAQAKWFTKRHVLK